MSVNLATLPSLPLSERVNLPDAPGIYFAISLSNEVLYVGRTVSLLSRWQAHHRQAQLERTSGVRIAWLLVDDPALLPELERTFINSLRPVLNRTQVPRRAGSKISISLKLPVDLWNAISTLAKQEHRTMSNMIERLLKESPRVREVLETETAGAST